MIEPVVTPVSGYCVVFGIKKKVLESGMYLLYDPETTFGTNIQAQCEKFSLYKHFSNITAEVLEVRFC